MNSPIARARAQRGFAMFAVLGVVLLLSVIIAFTIEISGQERRQAGKAVHNQSLLNATESALQYGKSYFLTKYPGGGWDTYLAYFVTNPAVLDTGAHLAATITAVKAFDPGLIPPQGDPDSNYSCFIYARDDVDELDTPNNPSHDNNQLIFVGAVCAVAPVGTAAPLVAELSGPVIFAAPGKY